MNEAAREYLAAIERPLRFLAKAGPRQIQNVKNLSTHVLELSQKALKGGLSPADVEKFRSLQELFAGFELLEGTEKKSRIDRALSVLGHRVQGASTPKCFQPEDHLLPTQERIGESHKILSRSVQFVKGVGPSIADKFRAAHVSTVDDLLTFFPTRYEDRRTVTRIRDLKEGEVATVVATVQFAGVAFYKGLRRRVFEALLEDGSGKLKLKWFRFLMGSLNEKIKTDQSLIVHGKVQRYRGVLEMHHPDFEVHSGEVDSISFGRIVPIYREVGGLYQKTIRKIMSNAIATFVHHRLCVIPPQVCHDNDLYPSWKAIRAIHHPSEIPSPEQRTPAQRSLAFEELFFYCLSLGVRKQLLREKPGIAFASESPRYLRLIDKLPFHLTRAQENVLQVVRKEMALSRPMNRLLQGDVGSGKTIVAFLAALVALDHDYQTVFMAPTEILAEQHFNNLRQWGKLADAEVQLLTGGTSSSAKKRVLEQLATGEIDIIVGTHALLESHVKLKKVGLVVVDEQHRFGVAQRAALRSKALEPDVLVMSATPIPRTLALTLYGDLDVSILNELPAGRKPIATRIFKEGQRKEAYELVAQEIQKGRQAYVVYPLIEASEKIDLKDATSMAEQFAKVIFPQFKVGLLHGALSSEAKERLMRSFANGEIDILVATTVIEVGIDVPNASVMVIEHPERFGLSQLHQLRGRVGRGTAQSFCFLLAGPKLSKLARERVALFARIHDGFVLAEEDLRLRGPGDFFGVEQSGFPTFQTALFPRDLDLLERARHTAFSILEQDPGLEQRDHKAMKSVMEQHWVDRVKLVRVG